MHYDLLMSTLVSSFCACRPADVSAQAISCMAFLIEQAADENRLCEMYEGWMPWI